MTEEKLTVTDKELPVGENLVVLKNRLKGEGSDGRICIVTGTHGDELEGQYVCYLINRHIKRHPEKLKGTVDIYPALNPMGIDTIIRGIPGFDLDMNRTFPGNPDGAVTEQIAHDIIADMIGSDLVVDIHASNIFLQELPQARISIETEESLLPLAKLLNLDLIWVHASSTVLHSTLAHSLNSMGTKTIVAEMGVGMRVTKRYGEQLTKGLFNVMKALGIWEGSPEPLSDPYMCHDDVEFINAPVAGLFIPEVQQHHPVRKDSVIGKILEPLRGKTLSVLKSPCDGIIFTLREYPIVDEGSLIARILRKTGGEAE